eukprot:6387358-Pyramimonas_sp.AAC.1
MVPRAAPLVAPYVLAPCGDCAISCVTGFAPARHRLRRQLRGRLRPRPPSLIGQGGWQGKKKSIRQMEDDEADANASKKEVRVFCHDERGRQRWKCGGHHRPLPPPPTPTPTPTPSSSSSSSSISVHSPYVRLWALGGQASAMNRNRQAFKYLRRPAGLLARAPALGGLRCWALPDIAASWPLEGALGGRRILLIGPHEKYDQH